MKSAGSKTDRHVDNTGRRLAFLTIMMLAGTVLLVIAVLALGVLLRGPRLVLSSSPPSFASSPAIAKLTVPVPANISRELVQELVEAYGLEQCEVGKRYGALCQNGEVEYRVDEAVCREKGGVKDWIECRWW